MILILTCLSILYTVYFCKTLLLPILIALFVSMCVSPACRKLESLGIPKHICALISLSTIITLCIFVSLIVADPLQQWLEKFPQASEKLTQKITEITVSFDEIAKSQSEELYISEKLIGKATTTAATFLASSTPAFIAQMLSTIVLSFFLLINGRSILSKTIGLRKKLSEKKLTLDITHSIQSEISYYLTVVVTINTMLGCLVAALFYCFDIPDPILWGTLAMALNFAPYLGPLVMMGILMVMGLIEYNTTWSMLTPLLIYGTINLIEANFVTPMVLGKKLKIDPLVVLLWLILWGWMWGAAGFLLGVPMLVCFKIVAEKLNLYDACFKQFNCSK